MRGLAAKTAARLRSWGERDTNAAAHGVHGELAVRAQQLFGRSVVVKDVEIDDTGRLRAFVATFDLATAAALTHPQHTRRAEWQLRHILAPHGDDLVTATWDLERCVVRVAATTLPELVPAVPRGAAASNLPAVEQSYNSLAIPIGVAEDRREIVWPLREAPHCVIAKQVAGIGLSTMVRTIITAAADAGVCVVMADFSEHDDFAGFVDWPNMHLVGRDYPSAARTIGYVADILERRVRGYRGANIGGSELPDGAPILLVVHGFDAPRRSVGSRFEDLQQRVDRIRNLGREFRVHSLLTFAHGYMRLEDSAFASLLIQLGRLQPLSSMQLGIENEAGNHRQLHVRGRGIAKLNGGVTLFQGYLTPDPKWSGITEADTEALDALRPPTSLYPRMVIDLPSTMSDWNAVLSAPVVTAETRPDLDPLSFHYQPPPSWERPW